MFGSPHSMSIVCILRKFCSCDTPFSHILVPHRRRIWDLRIHLLSCMRVSGDFLKNHFWFPALVWMEPINSAPCVRPCVCLFGVFLENASLVCSETSHEVGTSNGQNVTISVFGQKIPFWQLLVQIWPFCQKIAFWALFSETLH